MHTFNWVDVVIILIFFFYLYYRYDRGVFSHLFVLAGLIVMLTISFLAYPLLGTFLTDQQGIFRNIANAGAFVALFTGGQLGYLALLSPYVQDLKEKAFEASPLIKKLNKPLGVIPAVLTVVMVTSVALSVLVAIPISREFKIGVTHSIIGGRLFAFSVDTTRGAETRLGRPAGERMVFVVPELKPEEGGKERERKLSIPKVTTGLVVDSEDEIDMLDLINQERVKRDIEPLVLDVKIRSVARQHSKEMWNRHYFGHDSPVSGSPFKRMEEAGIEFETAGENIALAPDVYVAHQGFMNSPSHRKNILNPDFKKVGIGIVSAGVNGDMFTQDFTD